jgi:hypothetical protein
MQEFDTNIGRCEEHEVSTNEHVKRFKEFPQELQQ